MNHCLSPTDGAIMQNILVIGGAGYVGAVLVPKLLAAPLPDKGAAVPVNDRHGVEETKAGEHIAIGQHCTGVGVRPLMPSVEGTDTVSLYIQVLIAMPFPDDTVLRRDLPEVIAPDVALVLCARLAAFDVRHHVSRHGFPPQYHGVAIGQTAKVMMHGVFAMLPEDLAIPVQLHERASGPAKRDWTFAGPARHQEVPIVEEIAIGPWAIGQCPVLHDATLHIDEIGAGARHRGEQRIAVVGLIGVIDG